MGALQIDSVNVLVRAHYMPLFSRLGPYRLDLLDDLAYRRRELFEYWGHEASLLPVSMHPLFRHRMSLYDEENPAPGSYGRLGLWARQNQESIDAVLQEVAERGPLSAAELRGLHEPRRRSGTWWTWGTGKAALEWLLRIGKVTVSTRRNFERVYDLTERVLPSQIVSSPLVPENQARGELILIAARALGVATVDDLADCFCTPLIKTRSAVSELLEDSQLQETRVEGWRNAHIVPGGPVPRTVSARALVSPFDPLIWYRKRTERMFGFAYRIEIYTPAGQRRYGYYVLPFLLGERLVGRLDLKANRKAGVLLVPAVHLEAGVDAGKVVEAMADELSLMAEWLGLDSVRVGGRGKPATELRRRVR